MLILKELAAPFCGHVTIYTTGSGELLGVIEMDILGVTLRVCVIVADNDGVCDMLGVMLRVCDMLGVSLDVCDAVGVGDGVVTDPLTMILYVVPSQLQSLCGSILYSN